ncbi:TonB-linked SusC/RagA family outer membrane protein [Pedobacter sp. CAN_A7]|uniref:TonB-dependent receptor n=1 Tax=Pedobacter sp. CAN_A7 TaxID=2787722 RepID=UPI0018C9866F
MKLTILLLTIGCLHLSAKVFSQRINLNEKNASLSSVIKSIEKQSGYHFFYDNKLVKPAGKVTISLKNVTLEQALSRILKGKSLSFSIVDHTVVLKHHEESFSRITNDRVTGKVTDEQGMPIPGVSVKIKNSTGGAVTDNDGKFQITAKIGDILMFSYIGYTPREVSYTGESNINISLSLENVSMDEVVVVGYGSQKKANLIGSVAQLTAKEINDRPVSSLSNAMTGQLPGVTIIQRSGQPGSSGGNIQIRGVGSFGANAAAFILVDGIPVNSFNDIDPNDVENISVLKDASTAAIYGSRAANGVILVTTKTGKSLDGKIKIDYNGYAGTQKATAYPEFVNSWEYAALLNEAQPGAYTAEEIQKFRDGSDKDNYPNENYIDQVLKKSTFQTGHNLSFSNNTGNTQYLLSTGYLYQNGIVAKNDYSRYNLRFNMVNTFANNLKLTTRLSGAQYIDNQPAPPASLDWTDMLTNIGQVIRVPAIYVNQLSNGDYGLGVVAKGTPVSYSNNESFFKNNQTDLLANMRLDWDVIKNLKLSVIGGYTQLNINSQRFLANQRLNATVTLGPGILIQSNGLDTYKTLQQLAEYKRGFGKHELGLLLGHSYEYNKSALMTGNRSGYNSNTLTELNAGNANTQQNSGTAAEYTLDSYFARLNYNFDNRYLAEGTFRYDGSSRFPSDSKYADFTAAAVGWRISEEKFLKDKISWLNELKLKASYGTLGNQNIGNYAYQNVLSSGYNYPFGGSLSSGLANVILRDPTIHWESTRTKDIGMDAGFFAGKLRVSATYFDRYTYDILVSPSASVSGVLGFGVGVQNSGKLSNKGWEFTLDYRNNIGDFSYNINTNFSIVNNQVLDLGVGNIIQPNGLTGNGSTLFIGSPMNIYYGYEADGLFIDVADIEGYPDQKSVNAAPKPGDIRYKDISGPGGVPDGKVDATYDRKVLGSQIPKYTYGVNLGANYKNFDISILLQGVADVKGYLNGYAGLAFYQNGNIQKWQMEDHWTTENPNPNAKYPRLEVISNQGTPNTLTSSFWMLNGNYLKVRNIQLGYKLANTALKKTGLQSIRIYATAQNPLAFTKYPTGWDPEINTSGNYYPILANYTLGLNVTF